MSRAAAAENVVIRTVDGKEIVTAAPTGLARFREHAQLLLMQLALAVVLLGAWELVSGRVISDFWVSRPSKIVEHLIEIVGSGQLLEDLYVTLYEALIGYVIAAILGVLSGIWLGRKETLARLLSPFIMAFYGVPRIALAPLFIIWFGIGPTSKIVLAGTVVFFLTFFNTYSGVRGVDPELKNMIRVMGGRERDVMKKIVLPAASPWIIAGLKMSVPYALVGAIVGEFMAASKGLGFRIQFDSALFNTTGTMTGVVILAVLVVLGNDLLDRAERFVLRWRPTEGSREAPEMY